MLTESGTSPFVLIHGGRHGGWAWRLVAETLRQAGHEVFTPTLTGLGERAHLLTPQVGLDTHIKDVIGVFNFEDLDNAILVAHSYGGMVVSGALEVVYSRVRHVVFLDAHMPTSGESVFDLIGPERNQRMREMADVGGHGWVVPTSDASWWGITDPDQLAWVNSKVTPQPLKTYTDHLGHIERVWTLPGTFIECNPSRISELELERVRARDAIDSQFSIERLDTCHEAMITAPKALADILIRIAG